MAFEYENQFREAHPETVGEKDKHFDLDNYKDFLESRIKELEAYVIDTDRILDSGIEIMPEFPHHERTKKLKSSI